MLKKAIELAQQYHKGQFRRDGITPYFNHVATVAEKLTTEEEKTVAYLHDIIEDTDCTLSTLMEHFPFDIVQAVHLLTHKEGVDYFTYIHKINEFPDPLIKRVKIADILSNLGDSPTEKQVAKYTLALNILLGYNV